MKYKNILWDLDGTLIDPKQGIIKCIQYALEKYGLPAPPMDDLLWCIGPPLYESFPLLVPNTSPQNVNQLVDYYRERFSETGMYENVVYPEISDVLQSVGENHRNFLATSKPHFFARKILTHFKLDSCFQGIYGSEMNGERSNKGELIKYILEKENLKLEETIMIGDRKHDVLGAKQAEIASIGITWGYGNQDELAIAGANHILEYPTQLLDFFISKT